MDGLLIAAIAFAFSQLMLSALLLWRSGAWSVQTRLFGLLLLCVAGYLLEPLGRGSGFVWLTQPLQTAVPGLFWLFSASLFDDHFRLRRWQVVTVATTVLLPLLGAVGHQMNNYQLDIVLIDLPQLMEFVLVGLTLTAVARYWPVDLIESRRRLRLWFCALNGFYIFVLLLLREVVFASEVWPETLQYLPVGGLLLATNAILLEFRPGLLAPQLTAEVRPGEVAVPEPLPAGEVESADAISQELLDRLHAVMEVDRVYREMGLTIGKMAARLGVPEYRLRTAINHGLGYRNFNDFINTWRIREAAQRLESVDEASLPVLTIAMDCGFRSLSSFNKTFRDRLGQTPTTYRRQHLSPQA